MSYRYIDNPLYYSHQQHSSSHRYHGDYYQPQQRRRPHHALYGPPIKDQSRSTNRSYHEREKEERYYRDHGWYYPEEVQRVPRRRQQQQQQQQNQYGQRINKNGQLVDEDGEPLTELELLALENALKNEIESKRLVIESPIELPIVKDEVIEGDDLSSLMESLSVVDSTTSTLEVQDNESPAIKPSKKKRWPLSFLFKRDHPTTTTTPPTPVLSPDTSILTSSTISSSSSVIEEEGGIWAFKYPTPVPMTPTVWIRFDKENQKKIFQHLKQQDDDDVIQFTDSHICGGKLPIAVVPVQMRCYIPTDIEANQIAYFDLNFIPTFK